MVVVVYSRPSWLSDARTYSISGFHVRYCTLVKFTYTTTLVATTKPHETFCTRRLEETTDDHTILP